MFVDSDTAPLDPSQFRSEIESLLTNKPIMQFDFAGAAADIPNCEIVGQSPHRVSHCQIVFWVGACGFLTKP